MFLGNQVAADDPRLTAVYDNFRQNLVDICGIARRAGAGVILSTVAVNLRDCPPFASQHRPDLSPEELTEWTSIYQAGVDLESRSRWGEALKKYEAAARIDDRFAELQFRLGRCLAADGAAQPRPANGLSWPATWTRCGSGPTPGSTRSSARWRQRKRPSAFVGWMRNRRWPTAIWRPTASRARNLFYEHVHLKFDGNYLLARTVMEQVEAALPQLAASRKAEAVLSREQCAESLVLTPWDEYQMVRAMTEVMTRPPFNSQLDHAVRVASLRERSGKLRRLAMTPQALEAAYERYEAALEKSPDDWDCTAALGRWRWRAATRGWPPSSSRIVLKKMPWDPAIYIDLGEWRRQRQDR